MTTLMDALGQTDGLIGAIVTGAGIVIAAVGAYLHHPLLFGLGLICTGAGAVELLNATDVLSITWNGFGSGTETVTPETPIV